MCINNKFKSMFMFLLLIFVLSGCGNNSEISKVDEISESNMESTSEEVDESHEMDDEENISTLDSNSFKLYISADRTGTKESGISIEQGIRTALSEIDYMVKGKKIELVILDHKGSTPRANIHLESYLEDDRALVVFSGLHSPPLLASRDFINENKILLLDPWAAAAPITRYPSKENWIFRLSVDDSKAGYLIASYAIEREKFKSPFLLLENTGWGKSNEKTMTSALEEYSIIPKGISWYNWNLGINEAKMLLRQGKESGADVIFFVGNAPEGKIFAKAMSQLKESEKMPIRSHWGITGGNFPEEIDKEIRDKIDLLFIQTSFSFINMGDHQIGREVFERAKSIFPDEIRTVEDIKAPTGFIHSYDLTKILIAAMNESNLDGDITYIREELRLTMENLDGPIKGLIKNYQKPFSVFSSENYDGHEALDINDLRMAMFGDNNEIILISEEGE